MSDLVTVQSQQLAHPIFDRHHAVQVAVEKRNALVEFVQSVMKENSDYGKIPGTDKPTLLKPGAEKLCTLFNYSPRFEIIEKNEDWTGVSHNGEAFFYYWYRCRIFDVSGNQVAEGEGSCNSWEKKYRYRDAKPICPDCGQMTVQKSKEYGKGYYCWKKIGGCGSTFPEGDDRIVSQPLGKVPNPDIFDQVNTLKKMSQKRALLQAVLIACNASEFFTQDLDDLAVIDVDYAPVQSEPKKQAITQAQITRLTTIASKTGYSDAALRAVVSKYGFNTRKAITTDVYEDLCNELSDPGSAKHWNAQTSPAKEEGAA